ncbi:DNA primase, partial [Treponema pallidum]
MARISAHVIDAIADRVDLVSLVGNYTHLERRGDDWWGRCPFHHERTPSFHVVPDKKMYYCFGCGVGGSTIKFFMEIEKIDFHEAAVRLAKRAGIEMSFEDGVHAPSAHASFTMQLCEVYQRIAETFHHVLMHTAQGARARAYLASRKVTDDSIRTFKLGYAPPDPVWLFQFLRHKGYSPEFLARSGLFAKKSERIAVFSDRIMYPIADRYGQVIAFGARALGTAPAKYLNTADMPQYKKGEHLFAFHCALSQMRKTRAAIICEGYMDVIAFHQAQLTYAVAPLGALLTKSQARLMRSFVDRIYMCFDADGAGRAATYKAILLCRSLGFEVRIVELNGGTDPAECACIEGEDALRKSVERSTTDAQYLIRCARHEHSHLGADDTSRAVSFLFPYLSVLDSAIQREQVMQDIAMAFGIRIQAVHADYLRYVSRTTQKGTTGNCVLSVQGTAIQVKEPATGVRTAQLRLVLAVVANPELFELLRESVCADDFEDPMAKELFIILEECYRADTRASPHVLSCCTTDELRKLVSEAIVCGEFSCNAPQIVRDGVALVRRNRLLKERESLVGRLRRFGDASSGEECGSM